MTQHASRVAGHYLTDRGCVRLWYGVLAGQSHLGGRRIGPRALKEAAKCHRKAQHNDLQEEERHRELSIPRSTEKTSRPATRRRSGETDTPPSRPANCTYPSVAETPQPRNHGRVSRVVPVALLHWALARWGEIGD